MDRSIFMSMRVQRHLMPVVVLEGLCGIGPHVSSPPVLLQPGGPTCVSPQSTLHWDTALASLLQHSRMFQMSSYQNILPWPHFFKNSKHHLLYSLYLAFCVSYCDLAYHVSVYATVTKDLIINSLKTLVLS